jgi:hypothetical protein
MLSICGVAAGWRKQKYFSSAKVIGWLERFLYCSDRQFDPEMFS